MTLGTPQCGPAFRAHRFPDHTKGQQGLAKENPRATLRFEWRVRRSPGLPVKALGLSAVKWATDTFGALQGAVRAQREPWTVPGTQDRLRMDPGAAGWTGKT